jgi:C1A family cysteine protease
MSRRYGWVPDLPDHRDLYYLWTPRGYDPLQLPPKVDLRAQCPAVYNQGELGSCTANAIGAAHQFEQVRGCLRGSVAESFVPSRLFIYWNERKIEGTVDQDSGAMLRDGIKSVVRQGVCPESEWPYVTSRFTRKPSIKCYRHALDHQVLKYQRLRQTITDFQVCLAAGHPFVFGFSVYESFETQSVAKAGVVPMPGPGERLLGGHAVMAVGYDSQSLQFIVRNSWGEAWGDKGYFYMPFKYLVNSDLSADFWTITLVEEDAA